MLVVAKIQFGRARSQKTRGCSLRSEQQNHAAGAENGGN